MRRNVFIEAIIPIWDEETIQSLEEEGLMVSRHQKKAVLFLPRVKEHGNQYYIPESIGKKNLAIVAHEFGGSRKKHGKATVICTPGGAKLYPYRTFDFEWKADRSFPIQAAFCAPAVTAVIAQNRSGKILIINYVIKVEGWKAILDKELVWNGNVSPITRKCEICGQLENNLTAKHTLPNGNPCAGTIKAINAVIPQELQKFKSAILIALTKVLCYHCAHAHYAINSH
jgi:hypothetical protein